MNVMTKIAVIVLVGFFIVGGCNCPPKKEAEVHVMDVKEKTGWKTDLEAKLKVYGHRNWIVVADGAHPQQSKPAIETITIDASQLDAVAYVSELITKATHVDANIFVDKEMAYVAEENAKGITTYRNDLHELLKDNPLKTMLHEDIIRELDASA